MINPQSFRVNPLNKASEIRNLGHIISLYQIEIACNCVAIEYVEISPYAAREQWEKECGSRRCAKILPTPFSPSVVANYFSQLWLVLLPQSYWKVLHRRASLPPSLYRTHQKGIPLIWKGD